MLKGILLANLATILMGFTGIFGKLVVADASVISGVRSLFAAAFFGAFLCFKKKKLSDLSLKFLAIMALSGLFLCLHWWAFFHCIRLSSVALGVFTFATFPFLVTLYESTRGGQRLSRCTLFFSCLALLGVGVIVWAEDWNSRFEAIAIGLLSAAFFACFTIVNKNYVGKRSASELSFFQNFFSVVFLLPFFIPKVHSLRTMDWFWLCVLGVVLTGLLQVLYMNSMKFISAKLASTIASLEAFYGVIIALLVLGEKPHIDVWYGGALIFIAIISLSFQENLLHKTEVLKPSTPTS